MISVIIFTDVHIYVVDLSEARCLLRSLSPLNLTSTVSNMILYSCTANEIVTTNISFVV